MTGLLLDFDEIAGFAGDSDMYLLLSVGYRSSK